MATFILWVKYGNRSWRRVSHHTDYYDAGRELLTASASAVGSRLPIQYKLTCKHSK